MYLFKHENCSHASVEGAPKVFPSGPFGLGGAAGTMVWVGVPTKWREQKSTSTYILKLCRNSYQSILLLPLPLPLPLPLLATCHHHNHGRSMASLSSSSSSSYRHRHCRHHHHLIVMSSCPLPSFVVSSPSFFTHFITISPLVPPSFVYCCFKRQTKPLLPAMVLSLSSRPSALVGCFRCPPPPTLAASHVSQCEHFLPSQPALRHCHHRVLPSL